MCKRLFRPTCPNAGPIRGLLVCGAFLCAVAAVQGETGSGAAGKPRIELSATEWDFGDKWSAEPAVTILTVSNTGDAPLQITDVGRDCSCVIAKMDKRVLEPGESVDVEVMYGTRKPKPRPRQKIWFNSNDPDTPVATFTITGHVKQVFNINVSHQIAFGVLGRADTAEKTVEITSSYDKPLKLELAPIDSKHVVARLEPLEEGRRYKLIVTARPPLPYGIINVKAKVLTGLEFLPELPIRISGFVQPPVAVEPAEIIIPARAKRRMLRVLRVTNRRETPVSVVGVVSSHAGIKAELAPDATDGTRRSSGFQVIRIRVSLPPASEIQSDAAITIKTDDPEVKEIVVPVRLKRASPAVGD